MAFVLPLDDCAPQKLGASGQSRPSAWKHGLLLWKLKPGLGSKLRLAQFVICKWSQNGSTSQCWSLLLHREQCFNGDFTSTGVNSTQAALMLLTLNLMHPIRDRWDWDKTLPRHTQDLPLNNWNSTEEEMVDTMFWIALPRINLCRVITASSLSSSTCKKEQKNPS